MSWITLYLLGKSEQEDFKIHRHLETETVGMPIYFSLSNHFPISSYGFGIDLIALSVVGCDNAQTSSPSVL